MRRLLLVLVLSLPILAPALAAAPPTSAIVSMPTAPTVGAACSFRALLVAESNGHMYRCVAGKWFDLTSQVLLEAQINAGTIDGDLTVKGRVVSPTAQVGQVDFTTEGYAPAAIQGSQGGFVAAVSEGPHIDWGLNDLQLGTYRPGGVVGLWSDTAVRIEAPALTSGAYTTGGTIGKRTLPWTMAYVSSLDLTADGTADLTSDGSGAVVLHGVTDSLDVLTPLVACTAWNGGAAPLVVLAGSPNSPTPRCGKIGSSNNVAAYLAYEAGASQEAFAYYAVPQRSTGKVTVRLTWSATATSGNVAWWLDPVCTQPGESWYVAWAELTKVPTAVPASANTLTVTTITRTFTCAPGSMLTLGINRRGTDSTDTATTSTAYLYGLLVSFERR